MSMFKITSLSSLRSAKKSDPIAELKETGHEKRSRTPIFVGASIAALVMYMKSAHAAPVQGGQQPLPQQDNRDSEQSPSGDENATSAASHATDMPLPSSRQMLPEAQDPANDDSTVRSLGEWGWEITGTSPLHVGFGAGGAEMMRGFHVFGGGANDNGGIRKAGGHSRASKSGRGGSSSGSEHRHSKPNNVPTTSGPVVLEGGFAAMAVLFTLDDLLKGAADQDQDALHVFNVEASSGVVIPVEDGYMYIGDATGPVTLTYSITDGQSIVSQTANFSVSEHAATLGTGLADNIVGSNNGELIESGGGNDIIFAGDAIDTIYGGSGDDEIHGGGGNDVLVGGAGHDRLFGDAGNDVLFGGAGNDEIHGGDGGDRAYGGDGNDTIYGDAGQDVILGEAGNDTLIDGTGQDYVDGGDGNDTVMATADGEADAFDGGAGDDTLSYADSQHAVHIDIAAGEARGVDIGTDEIKNFEIFIGGQGNDRFVTGDEQVTLYGGAGDDTFVITAPGSDATTPIRHVIADFDVGDQVRMAGCSIFEKADVTPDFLDQMKALGNGEAPDNAVPVHIRYDAEANQTDIDADFNHDGVYEVTVEIDGQHNLQIHHNSLV